MGKLSKANHLLAAEFQLAAASKTMVELEHEEKMIQASFDTLVAIRDEAQGKVKAATDRLHQIILEKNAILKAQLGAL